MLVCLVFTRLLKGLPPPPGMLAKQFNYSCTLSRYVCLYPNFSSPHYYITHTHIHTYFLSLSFFRDSSFRLQFRYRNHRQFLFLFQWFLGVSFQTMRRLMFHFSVCLKVKDCLNKLSEKCCYCTGTYYLKPHRGKEVRRQLTRRSLAVNSSFLVKVKI